MRSTAYGANNSGKAITIILCLCIVAAAIWAATGDVAGGYISEKIIGPLFSKSETATTPPIVQTTPITLPQDDLAASSTMITVQLDFAPRTIYGLQVGAFSSYENALSGAKDSLLTGGAGYIITHGGFHKLYTCAYLIEANAQAQKTYLLAKNIDACITPIVIDGILLDISANQEQIDAINSSYSVWLDSADALFALSYSYQNATVTSTQVISQTRSIHSDIQLALADLEKYKDLSVITEKLYDNLSLCDEQLSSFLSKSLSNAEISSSIKYLMIDFIYRFGQYANEIAT